jgi:ATP-binding cassette, subfamily B, bacterial
VYGDLQRAAGATERLVTLLSIEPKIKNPTSPNLIPDNESYSLQFSDVVFFYPNRQDRPALKNLSLDLMPGKVTALVGPSGAGKSTIFDLIVRFHDPDSGSINLNGIDIRTVKLGDLRGCIGIVPQQPNLFTGTVYANLLYGRQDASLDEVIQACKAAHCYDFVQDMPEGFHSPLGENGVRLSGGQKQRIAIARAILKNPSLLLLDEATSALDAESEFHIQTALQELTANRTTLMIAHRLSTVIRADQIYVLDKGEIVGKGTHSELLKTNELYKKLASLQLFESTSRP